MGRDETRIYVGNLPPDVREKDIEDIFAKYGKVRFVDIKGGRGPLYAFVEFEDPRDAEDAVRGRDGYDFDGSRIRVEFTRGVGPRGAGGRPLSGRGGSFRGRGAPRGRGGPPSRRSNYRVIVEGLPATGSWQDLKDHMREAGEICYADVSRDGTGAVEFIRFDDMKYALKKLDDTKFRSHEGETSYIRVREDTSSGGGRGGRSRSDSRSRSPRRSSPKYSPRGSRSRSRSESRSKSRSRTRSPE
ncbi:hypothetical protein RB195_012370 [Necator americanus]|uniref:Uncharacterized protein n=2 Tax=Necator americanus TaxID=51031 RepID=W2THI8_NECAM|nr:hypothetical protein NECAME_09155 [Necator americanus]ETN80482.1 hypothetical protein NECAME_09155 [Necator americanus]